MKIKLPEIFDEYQKSVRNKFGKHAFIILLLLVFINGGYTYDGTQWATGQAEAYLLLFIPCTYFTFFCIINEASFNKREKSSAKTLLSSAIFLYIFSLSILIFEFVRLNSQTSDYSYIKNGLIQYNIVIPLFALYWLFNGIGYTIVYLKRRFNKERD